MSQAIPFYHLKSNCRRAFMQLIPNITNCNWKKIGRRLGKGVDGEVYQVCCNETNECNYVVKIFRFRPSFLDKLKREIKIQQKASRLGIAPFILDGFVCDDEGFIVMQKSDMSVTNYVKKLKSMNYTTKEIEERIDEIEKDIKNHVHDLHEYGILHDDLHIDNIMIDVDKNNDMKVKKVNIIDFGKSKETDDESVLNAESDKEIKMTFDKLRKEVLYSYTEYKDEDEKVEEEIDYSMLQAPMKKKQRRSFESPPRSPQRFQIVEESESEQEEPESEESEHEEEPEEEREYDFKSITRKMLFDD